MKLPASIALSWILLTPACIAGPATFDSVQAYQASLPAGTQFETATEEGAQAGRVFGIGLNPSDGSGRLFILERRDGRFVATESQPFGFSQWQGGLGLVVNGITIDGPDRFHLSLAYGNSGTPNSDTFRFKKIGPRWRLTGRDHGSTASCSDASIGSGDGYSVNYLTGKIVLDRFKDCRQLKPRMKQASFPAFDWADFDPFDPKLDVE